MTTEEINLDATSTGDETAARADINAPVEPLDIRLNFNCMLYLFTELVTLFNELVVVMKDKEQLTDEDIKRIYQITADKDTLTQTYRPVFNRFMEYYVSTKQDITGEVVQTVGGPLGARGENSATAENPAAPVSSTVSLETDVKLVQEEVEKSE